MKNHGLLAIWILAITVSAVLLFSGCRPTDPPVVEEGDDDSTSTCQVEAGIPYAREIKFYDGCNTDPAPMHILPDAWYGPALEDMVQIYADFEGVYRYDLVSCDLYYWHLQWIAGGMIYDSVASTIAEPDPMGGVEVVVLFPPEGCDGGSAIPGGNAFQVNNGTSVVGVYADFGMPLE